jgi:hypothetical protein
MQLGGDSSEKKRRGALNQKICFAKTQNHNLLIAGTHFVEMQYDEARNIYASSEITKG